LRSSRAREACSGPILRGTGSRSQLRVSWKQCVLLLPPRAREATVRTHTPRDRVGIAIAANLETVCPHLAQLARAGRAQDPYCEVRVEVAIAGKLETVVRVCLRAQGSLQKGMGAAPRQVFPVASFFFFQISFLRIRKASMSRGPWPFCCDRPVGEAYRLAQAPRPPVPRRRRPGAAVDQVKQLTTSNDGHARLTPRELEVLTAMAPAFCVEVAMWPTWSAATALDRRRHSRLDNFFSCLTYSTRLVHSISSLVSRHRPGD
jgi:hypothetical protein